MKIVEAREVEDGLKIKCTNESVEKFNQKVKNRLIKELKNGYNFHGRTSIGIRIEVPWEEKIKGEKYKLYEIDEGRNVYKTNTIILSINRDYYAIIDKAKNLICYEDLDENDISNIKDFLKVAQKNQWKFIDLEYSEDDYDAENDPDDEGGIDPDW